MKKCDQWEVKKEDGGLHLITKTQFSDGRGYDKCIKNTTEHYPRYPRCAWRNSFSDYCPDASKRTETIDTLLCDKMAKISIASGKNRANLYPPQKNWREW